MGSSMVSERATTNSPLDSESESTAAAKASPWSGTSSASQARKSAVTSHMSQRPSVDSSSKVDAETRGGDEVDLGVDVIDVDGVRVSVGEAVDVDPGRDVAEGIRVGDADGDGVAVGVGITDEDDVAVGSGESFAKSIANLGAAGPSSVVEKIRWGAAAISEAESMGSIASSAARLTSVIAMGAGRKVGQLAGSPLHPVVSHGSRTRYVPKAASPWLEALSTYTYNVARLTWVPKGNTLTGKCK